MKKFKLVKLEESRIGKFKVTIVGDSNDADYITEISFYAEDEFMSVIDRLKHLSDNFMGYHELEDLADDDIYNQLEENSKVMLPLPYSENGICHSLESIEIEYFDKQGILWGVELI